MGKVTLGSAKERAWKVFSEYIRKKYSDKDGIGTCITCGVRKPWKELQAGHAMSSRCNTILFEERLVRPQCYSCNCKKGGMPDEYHAWMLDQYGEDGYYELLRLKHGKDKDGNDIKVRFTIESLEEMIKEWREEIAKMDTKESK